MSGVYIKGFPVPNNCGACPLRLAWCRERIYMVNRPERCPLIPVLDHGRLIDADAFIKQKTEQICENCDRRRGMKDGKLTKRFVYAIGDAPCRACDTGDMLDYVDDAPTIIPGEEGEG